MLEKEIWGEFTKEDFDAHYKRFVKLFGEPKIKYRLGIEINDYNNTQLDTRIRITNGIPVIIQKVGKWDGEGSLEREEIEIELPKDAAYIYEMYKILSNLVISDNKQTNTFQNENYIFLTDKFEVKLTHQYGKSDVYTYELELVDNSLDLLKLAEELKIKTDLSPKNERYWKAFNIRVNAAREEYTDEEFLNLIQKFLDKK